MLKQELGVDSELKVGSGGIFEVEVQGRVVLKKATQAFPTEAEIVTAVGQALGRAGPPA